MSFIKRSSLIILALIAWKQLSFAQLPEVYTLWPVILQENKNAYDRKNLDVTQKVQLIVEEAKGLLKSEAHSVMDKKFTPSSGTKHDYMSLGPYWWPDPTKPDGLPYIRKDGQRNSEIKNITDRAFLGELEYRCKYLALAYYFTGEEKYAAKARALLKTWFINPETKMNPNLNFGQAIPGLNEGRGIGIIESRLFVDILNWVGLLRTSDGFLDQELPMLKAWFSAYLKWMLNSDNGKDEANAKNNHGTFYELQVATFASFISDEETLNQVFSKLGERMNEQFDSDGKQPLELERTNALGYSTMNLSGWFSLAVLGEKHGYDLWFQLNSLGARLNKAFLWLYPYVNEHAKFPYQQINKYQKSDFYPLVLIANQKYQTRLPLNKYSDQSLTLADLLYSLPLN